MAHVIDLKKKKEEVPAPPPVIIPPPIQHPIKKEKKILTDTGKKIPFDTLSWRAPVAYRREGSRSPYFFAGALFVVAALMGVFQRELTSVILFALMGVMVIVFARRAIPAVDIEISPIGVRRGARMYAFSEIASFCIHQEPNYEVRELSIQLKKWTSPYIKIQLADQDPVQVRSILLEFIPEAEHPDMGTHALVRKLGI